MNNDKYFLLLLLSTFLSLSLLSHFATSYLFFVWISPSKSMVAGADGHLKEEFEIAKGDAGGTILFM